MIARRPGTGGLAASALALVVLGLSTCNWVSVVFPLGGSGFAVTVALQQPLVSLIAWVSVVVTRPDRIAIGDTRGDVVSTDVFVTEIRETHGELVESNQPPAGSSPCRTAPCCPPTS